MLHRFKNYFFSSHFSNYGIAVFVVFFWTIILYFSCGVFYEDHTGLGLSFSSGYLTGGEPFSDFYVYCQTFVGEFYAFLHRLYQPFPWVGMLFFTYLLLASVILTFGVSWMLRKQFPAIKYGAMFTCCSLFFLLVLADNFVSFSAVRISYLATCASLVGISWLIGKRVSTWKFWFSYFSLFLLFLAGFLTRPESGFGACMFAGIFALLSGESFKKLLVFYLPAGLFGLFTILYLYHKADEIPFLKAIEPDLYYISDGTFKPDLAKGKSPLDSIKYKAISEYFINDEGQLTVQLIKNMVDEKIELAKSIPNPFFNSVKTALKIMRPDFIKYIELFLFNLLLLCGMLVAKRRKLCSGQLLVYYLAFQIFFWTVLFVLAYFIKMESRMYVPMLGFYTFTNLMLVFKADIKAIIEKQDLLIRVSIVFALILCGSFATKLFTYGFEERKKMESYKEVLFEINKVSQDKILLLDVYSAFLTSSTPFELTRFPYASKLFLYDQGQFAFIPTYKKYLDTECNCNSARMNEFYLYLYEHKEKVVFVSNEDRINLVKGYLEIVHGVKYEFIPLRNYNKVHQLHNNSMSPLNYYVFK